MKSVLGSVFIFSSLIIMVTSTFQFRSKFYLTNSINQAKEIHPSNESMAAANFMFDKPTVVLIHDYADNANGTFNKFVTHALKETQDSNIINVDWTHYSKTEYDAYINVNLAGHEISFILYILCENFNYSPENIHIIGFGAGAQTAGVAGRLFLRYDKGIIDRITGLDPLATFYTKNGYDAVELGKDSARFVEVIHTSIQGESGDIGCDKPMGHLDFYPNGGRNMPGCEHSKHTYCSHHMSYKYLAEALQAEQDNALLFIGKKCDTYKKAIEKKCENNSDLAIFGAETKNARPSGVYYFETNPTPPFAQGRVFDFEINK